ncbi:MAG: hypothetical protein ACRED1_10890, partial [Limisphaerales bacterium]
AGPGLSVTAGTLTARRCCRTGRLLWCAGDRGWLAGAGAAAGAVSAAGELTGGGTDGSVLGLF